MRRTTSSLISVISLVLACTTETTVHVDVLLMTDYFPGRDFAGVESALPEDGNVSLWTQPEAQLFTPSDIARWSELVPVTRRRLKVRLVDAGGETARRGERALERAFSFASRRDHQQLVVFCRACEDVDCPPGFVCSCDPTRTCVPERCVSKRVAGCPERTRCTTDAECPSGPSECARPVCTEGFCLERLDDAVCDGIDHCSPAAGCAAPTWDAPRPLRAAITGDGDFFGSDVALDAQGETLVVGAYGEASQAVTGVQRTPTDNGAEAAGAAYVFRRQGVGWTQQAFLKAVDATSLDHFGRSVSISGDGSTIAIGVPNEDGAIGGVGGDPRSDELNDAGAVYVYRRRAGGWDGGTYLKASTPHAQDHFGSAVALSEDGRRLVVGAPGDGRDPAQPEVRSDFVGATYVFDWVDEGWRESAYLQVDSGYGDQFGFAVDLSADGSRLAVGAPFEDAADELNVGAVYLFEEVDGRWRQETVLEGPTGGEVGFERYGRSLSLEGDGERLAVGAPGVGRVHVYGRESDGAWQLRSSVGEGAEGFGVSVALSRGGRAIAVGSPSWNDSGVEGAGRVHVFDLRGGEYEERLATGADSPLPGARMGDVVATSRDGRLVAAGAPRAPSQISGPQPTNNAGAAYVVEAR